MPPDGSVRAGLHGRYVIGDEIAAGGMATVHLGRMLGDAGFARTVAIKRLHPQFAKDPDLCTMLLDEGRLAARIHHLNVVTTLDVVASGNELFIVMEYVHGESLSALIRAAIRRREKVPPRIAAAALSGALRGLHAAHEARNAHGEPLGLVHRDISPQNILVGSDGVARVLDFGIAKAADRLHVTVDGRIKGKFGYMPPEQLHAEIVDRRADIYAAGVVLWEALVGARLFAGRENAPDLVRMVDPPSSRVRELPPSYDAVVMRALSREAEGRFATALEMAEALEAAGPVAPPAEVGAWVSLVAGDLLEERAARIAAVETRLVTSIRDSLHLIEGSSAPITRLDGVGGAGALEAPKASSPPPPLVPSEPPPPLQQTVSASTPPGPRPDPGSSQNTMNDPLRARGSAALWIAAAALGAVAILATFAVIAGMPTSSARGSDTADPSASEAAPASASAAEPAPSVFPAEPAVVVGAPATATAATAASPVSRARVVAPAARPIPAAPRRPAGDACSPPFTIDGEGHKHYKRECLR
jgi:eukaryotic-like serine/threonine-protein kinase